MMSVERREATERRAADDAVPDVGREAEVTAQHRHQEASNPVEQVIQLAGSARAGPRDELVDPLGAAVIDAGHGGLEPLLGRYFPRCRVEVPPPCIRRLVLEDVLAIEHDHEWR